jgi:agmatine deiminase
MTNNYTNMMNHQSSTTIPKRLHLSCRMGAHTATWLSWPHKEESWPGKIGFIYDKYAEFVKELTKGELVRINVVDEQMQAFAKLQLDMVGVDLKSGVF